MSAASPLYSVIIPVFNSESIIEQTVLQTVEFFEHHQFRYELILVNDGSKDGSWQKIETLAQQRPHITAINLLRNYGQHSAIYCGIFHATGNYLITMDDDGQNPPGEIIHLINKIREGYDSVFAQFHRKQHGLIRKLGTTLINYLNRKVFHKPKDLHLTNFRIFNQKVADRIRSYRSFYPYIPGLILMFSASSANVPTEHHARKEGKSNYTVMRIIRLMGRLLINNSTYMLRIVTTTGFCIAGISFFVGAFYVCKNLFYGVSVTGWTTLVMLLCFLNGFIIVILGIMGEYLARAISLLAVKDIYQVGELVKKESYPMGETAKYAPS